MSRFDIFFESDESTVTCGVDMLELDDEAEDYVLFSILCQNAQQATILASVFNNALNERCQEIRRQAYELGYKDGKQKKRKLRDFPVWIDSQMR